MIIRFTFLARRNSNTHRMYGATQSHINLASLQTDCCPKLDPGHLPHKYGIYIDNAKYGQGDGTLCNDTSQTIWFET